MPGFDYGKYMASREGRSAMKDLGSGMGLTSEGDMPSEGTAALKAAGSVASMANPIPRAISAGAEGLRQIGKYGKDIDPRLAGLENLGGKSALSSKDIEDKLSGVPSQVAKGMKSIPGLNMTASDIAAGKDKKLVKSLYENPDAKMRKNYKNIMLEEFKSMPSDKKAATVLGSGYRAESDMMNDLNTNTASSDVAKMERLRKLVGRLVPSSLVAGSDKIGKTGVSSIASPMERGYLPNRSGKGLSLDELLNSP